MNEKLSNIIMNLGSPKVLVAGDFMLDVYIYGGVEKISPEAPAPVLKISETEHRCGRAGSVAVNLAVLGAKAYCLGVIGDDQDGEILKAKLTKAGANIDGLFKAANRPTTSKQRLIDHTQHPHRRQLMRIDCESAEPLSEELNEWLLAAYKETLPDIDIVCLQDHNKRLLSDALCRQMIRLANEANKKVLVDPSPSSDYSKYTGATAITLNRKESSTAVGFEVTNTATAAKAADYLFQKLRLQAVIITLDKEGAYLKTQSKGLMIPTQPRSVYDATGSGEMNLATLAAALAAGCDYENAVQLSNIASGIEVEEFGTATVTTGKIAGEISARNQDAGDKILPVDSLLHEIERHRRNKKTIVFTNGCFDVLHRGHLEYLRFCRRHGDVVILGLNSDKSVRMIKGPGRPINNQEDRAALLAAMEMVDYVTLFDEPSVLNLVKKVRPDVLIKGEDWAIKGVVGREFVESYGGKVVLAPLVENKSSSATLEKIKSLEM